MTASNASKDDDAREFVLSGGISFRENLVEQLGTQHLGEMDRKICEYIIGNIDDDGYLRRDVENIVDDLAFGAGIEVDDEKIESLLRVVQRFDPAGVGARDLRECLLLQVKRRLAETSTPGFDKCPDHIGVLFRGVLEETLREDFQADEDFRGGVERGGGRNSEIESQAGRTNFRFFGSGSREDYS